MRISDWSSDVCSSDLADPRPEAKREQKLKPATPSPAKPAAPAQQSLAPASRRDAGQGLKPGAGDYGPTRAGATLTESASTFVDDTHPLNPAMLAPFHANHDPFLPGQLTLPPRGPAPPAP